MKSEVLSITIATVVMTPGEKNVYMGHCYLLPYPTRADDDRREQQIEAEAEQ